MVSERKRIRLIGAACGLGAQDRGCADGPVAYHRSQAWQEISGQPSIDWGKILFPPDAAQQGATTRIAQLCRDLAAEVASSLHRGEFPLVIGGDHSVAIGNWSGLARFLGGACGLLWIDAHLDSHTPSSSYSGAVHGMPLACLLGHGDKRLLNLGVRGAQLSPAHVAVIGSRSYEPEEMLFLQRLGVRIFGVEDIDQRGFSACLEESLAIVGNAPGGFGVTIDLDAIDPVWAPGVGSPEPDGLAATDLLAALSKIAGFPAWRGLEIVEYNPDRDRYGLTARLISDLILQVLPEVAKRHD